MSYHTWPPCVLGAEFRFDKLASSLNRGVLCDTFYVSAEEERTGTVSTEQRAAGVHGQPAALGRWANPSKHGQDGGACWGRGRQGGEALAQVCRRTLCGSCSQKLRMFPGDHQTLAHPRDAEITGSPWRYTQWAHSHPDSTRHTWEESLQGATQAMCLEKQRPSLELDYSVCGLNQASVKMAQLNKDLAGPPMSRDAEENICSHKELHPNAEK